jgi:hypothetical protein
MQSRQITGAIGDPGLRNIPIFFSAEQTSHSYIVKVG